MKSVAFILLLACGNASAAEWVLAAERGLTDFYIDALSIEESGKYREAWIMLDHSKPRKVITLPEVRFRSAKQLLYFDCAKGASAVAQARFHAANMGKGEVLEEYSTSRTNASFSRHLPDTLKKKILDVVCSVPL